MFNYDFNKPGSSRQSYYSDEVPSSIYDYPPMLPRNMSAHSSSTADRVRDNQSHRGARQNFNTNFPPPNYYPHTPWTPATYFNNNQNQNNQKRPPHPPQSQPKDKRRDGNYNKGHSQTHSVQNTQHQQTRKPKTVGASAGQGDEKTKSTLLSKEIDYRRYKCPICTMQFDFSTRYNSYSGRVPLILNCKHTVCQDCIHKCVKDASICCPLCKNPSVIPAKCPVDDLQNIFSPNFYLIGFIMWSKTQGTNPNLMALVPVQTNSVSNKRSATTLTTPQSPSETCCFLSCNKRATLLCEDCSDIYCPDCCTMVHKSAKSLWSHKQGPIKTKTKGSLELEKCEEHNMDLEYYCTTCETNACCYCCVEKHESHTRDNLIKLNEEEMQELHTNKEKARLLLKQVLNSQKKLKELYSCNTSNIEKKISSFFLNYHARLQFIEKNLKKELASYSTDARPIGDVDELNVMLATSAANLSSIVASCDALETKKMNLKELSKRLREIQDVPCYLVSENGNGKDLDPLEFEVDVLANDLEDFFKISKSDSFGFRLVTEDDLPSDYEKDSFEHDSDVESSITSISKVSEEGKQLKKKQQVPKHFTGGMESDLVEVTHIDSLECFYVQMRKTQYQFSNLNRDIGDYIKMGAPTVDHPQLNELYLVVYQTSCNRVWCRGRITEFKNGEREPLYEVFFIDYGSTQTVDVSKLRQITPSFSQKKPFAIHCTLHNPTAVEWNKTAHLYMAKMLNGKQVSMVVKQINSGIHEVDLMIMSSDRGQTSITDLLIHTCNSALSNSSDNDSLPSGTNAKPSSNQGYKIFGNSVVFQKFQQERVILVNVIDPHHIFIHIVAHAESLKKMNNALKIRYKNSQKNSCLPVEGTNVIVDHKDPIRGSWHRGLVKKVDFSASNCQVLLIDWGLHIVVPWTNIRNIQEEFTRLESQAILVKLAHIEPTNKGRWLDSATTFLQKYMRSQEIMRMVVHSTEPLEVALFEMADDVDICLNAALHQQELARSTGKISQTLEWPRNDAEIKGFTDDDGLVASLLKQVEAISEGSDDEDQEEKNLVKQKIEVVKFVSPDLIFIKFSMYEPQEMSLHKELQIHYNNERKTKASWNANEMCVVIYNLSYVRGKIMSKVGDKKYKVNVYDRAVTAEFPLEKIFEYHKYFTTFTNVVFKSHLANIRPAGGEQWSMSSIEAMERMLDKYRDIYGTKILTGETEKKGQKSIPMHMWYAQVKMGGALEASKTKYISLNNMLVKLGFAYKVTSSKTPSVASSKSTGSKSSEQKSECSSPFISVLDKLAGSDSSSTAVDHSTDQDSCSDLIESMSQLESFELPRGEPLSELATPRDESLRMSELGAQSSASSLDWNKMVEEDEETALKKPRDEKDSPYRMQEAEINDWLPPVSIKEREFKAWVTCAEPGGILYLREDKIQTIYKEMEQNINEYFGKRPAAKEKHKWEVGQLCTVHFKGSYYRAKVYKVDSPDDITIVMIDFGSDHHVQACDLNREILYPKIPAFVCKIILHGLYPKAGDWLDSDYQTLLDTVSEYCKIFIRGPLDVEIPSAEVYTDKGVNVNETMARLCPNLSTTPPKQAEDSDDEGAVIEEEILEDQLIVEVEHSAEEPLPLEYKVLPFPDKKPGEKFEVSVMFVIDYNKLAIKEANTMTDEYFKLSEQIQAKVKHQPNLESLEVGMPCVCPFADDGTWYRGRIYSMDGADDCEYVYVFFVDFGNVESVAVSDIKKMKPEWFKLPVSCHITEVNIKIVSDKNNKHVTQYMKKIYGKTKLAELVNKDPLRINLFESDGTLCYQSLLDKGLVETE